MEKQRNTKIKAKAKNRTIYKIDLEGINCECKQITEGKDGY